MPSPRHRKLKELKLLLSVVSLGHEPRLTDLKGCCFDIHFMVFMLCYKCVSMGKNLGKDAV